MHFQIALTSDSSMQPVLVECRSANSEGSWRKKNRQVAIITRRVAVYLGTHCNISSKRAWCVLPPGK